MKTMTKTLLYACVLSMTVSCSGTSSHSSDAASDASPEIIDSIAVHQIPNGKVEPIEVCDLGTFPAGSVVREATAICNFDKERGVRIMSIDADSILRKCRPSLDSIEPGMLISVDFKLKVPEKKGPFDAAMRVHYKNVRKPSIFKVHGYAE